MLGRTVKRERTEEQGWQEINIGLAAFLTGMPAGVQNGFAKPALCLNFFFFFNGMPLVGAIIFQLATVPNSQPKSHLHVTYLAPFSDRSLQSTQPPPHQPLDNSACRLPAASAIYRMSTLLNFSLFLLSLNRKW